MSIPLHKQQESGWDDSSISPELLPKNQMVLEGWRSCYQGVASFCKAVSAGTHANIQHLERSHDSRSYEERESPHNALRISPLHPFPAQQINCILIRSSERWQCVWWVWTHQLKAAAAFSVMRPKEWSRTTTAMSTLAFPYWNAPAGEVFQFFVLMNCESSNML